MTCRRTAVRSFKFTVAADRWERATDGTEERTLLDVDLYEAGPVSTPAYATTAVAVS